MNTLDSVMDIMGPLPRRFTVTPKDFTFKFSPGRFCSFRGTVVKIHKELLCQQSHYFNCLYYGGFKKPKNGYLYVMKEIDHRTVELCITLIYKRNFLVVNSLNIGYMLCFYEYYGFDDCKVGFIYKIGFLYF